MESVLIVLAGSIFVTIGSFLWVLGYLCTPKGCTQSAFGNLPKHINVVAVIFIGSIMTGSASALVVFIMMLNTLL